MASVLLLAFLLVTFEVIERGALVTQTQVKVKGRSSSATATVSIEVVPLEIAQLLDVLARIELRRQAKLRASRKEVG